jgi:acetyl esterase/lipase
MSDAALRRLWLESVLTLPAPVLRAISAAGAPHGGDRTLDPAFQFLAATRRKRGGPGAYSLETARGIWSQLLRTSSPRRLAQVETRAITVDGADGPLAARLHTPTRIQPHAPLMLFLHDGGGVLGAPELSDGLLSRLAEVAGCPVVAPAYRLGPEHRFPAGLEDARAAYDWGLANASALGGACVAVGGQSLGAGFAAAICQGLKVEGRDQPVLQLLVCPILDAASDCQSLRTYADAWPLSRAALDWMFGHYLSPDDDPSDPRISPFRTPDAAGLAPALIVTAGFDPVVDQGELYARKLKAAGVPVVYRCYPSLPHAFPAFAGVAPSAETACREIGGLLREGLAGGLARACTLRDRTEEGRSFVL